MCIRDRYNKGLKIKPYIKNQRWTAYCVQLRGHVVWSCLLHVEPSSWAGTPWTETHKLYNTNTCKIYTDSNWVLFNTDIPPTLELQMLETTCFTHTDALSEEKSVLTMGTNLLEIIQIHNLWFWITKNNDFLIVTYSSLSGRGPYCLCTYTAKRFVHIHDGHLKWCRNGDLKRECRTKNNIKNQRGRTASVCSSKQVFEISGRTTLSKHLAVCVQRNSHKIVTLYTPAMTA